MTGEPRHAGGQANLLAVVAALFALTATTTLAVAVADGALVGADREAAERHAASALAERLVAADSPLTRRPNVLDPAALDGISAADLRRWFPVLGDRSVRLAVDGRVVASDGTPEGGTAMRRVVLLETTERLTVEPAFSTGNGVVLPRRTSRADLELDHPENVSITVVRANGRTVLRDPDGLRGRYTVPLPRRETVELAFVANDTLAPGDVTATLYPRNTTKAQLVVTVDD